MSRFTGSALLMMIAACASTAEVAPGGRSPEQQAIYESCIDMEPSYPSDCADVADSAREFQQAEADSVASGTMDSATTCKLCTCHDERCVCGDSAPPKCSTCPGWCAPPRE